MAKIMINLSDGVDMKDVSFFFPRIRAYADVAVVHGSLHVRRLPRLRESC